METLYPLQEPQLNNSAEHKFECLLSVVGTERMVSITTQASVGSDEACDLVLDDPYVSKRHCVLERRGARIWVRDRRSRNGTWVNNVRVDRCALPDPCRIDLGRTRLRLVYRKGRPGDDNPLGIVGRHPAMTKVFRRIRRYAPNDLPVLIVGETGTGKELVARALHDGSPRADRPFEAINCAAIPRELAESELFGHERGAFTGAAQRFSGAFSRADGGTLFFDEIGEMPLDLQPKLLRALEEGEIRPVGAETSQKVAIRLVAATNRDLLAEVERGRFRHDLYYRLAVGIIDLPALRQRASDIGELVQHFVRHYAGEGAPRVNDELMAWLGAQSWPGNVRALRHAIQRALAECEGDILRRSHFDLRRRVISASESVLFAGRAFKDVKTEIFSRSLALNGGNRSATAMALGIPKSTFFDQLRVLEL
ncbi:MAG: sigma 54-interacting transcriptional regulator [Deltaproteobacteria bacterium]|nr:sigma 54-interacting transcriptional regulator [Deltaproteobacteria bacterium]